MVYIIIQNNLSYKKNVKGLLYGLSFGVLYLIGMFESSLLSNTSPLNEFIMGLADFIPILLLGILLGIFTRTDKT